MDTDFENVYILEPKWLLTVIEISDAKKNVGSPKPDSQTFWKTVSVKEQKKNNKKAEGKATLQKNGLISARRDAGRAPPRGQREAHTSIGSASAERQLKQ